MLCRHQPLVELRADIERSGYTLAKKAPTVGQLSIPLQFASSVSILSLLFPKLLWQQKVARPLLVEVGT